MTYAERVVTAYTTALKASRHLRGDARHAARKELSDAFFRLMAMARLIEGPQPFAVAI